MTTPSLPGPDDLVAVSRADVEDLTRAGEVPTVLHRFGDVAVIRVADGRARPATSPAGTGPDLSDPLSLPREELVAHLDLAAFAYRRSGEMARRATGTVNMMSAVSGEAAAGDLP